MPSGVFICIYGTQIELFKTNIENILSEYFVYVWTRIQAKGFVKKRDVKRSYCSVKPQNTLLY